MSLHWYTFLDKQYSPWWCILDREAANINFIDTKTSWCSKGCRLAQRFICLSSLVNLLSLQTAGIHLAVPIACKQSLKIPKGYSKSVNWRTDNPMGKMMYKTPQKTKDRTQRFTLKPDVNSGAPEGWVVIATYVSPVLILLSQIRF